MHFLRPKLRIATGLAVSAALLGVCAGTPAAAAPKFTAGTQTLNDELFPTIGNGGYDARHYNLALDYDIRAKRLTGRAGIDAVATKNLSRFSFDLTAWNRVSSVTVDGRRATFAADAKRSKLQITPPRGIVKGRRFRTVVRYSGVQRALPSKTRLTEGWIPNAKTGAVVVGQPVGAMGWYPNNNVPSDKATYATRITVPRGWDAIGPGVLATRSNGRAANRATTTYGWKETAPTASYLVSVAIGKFDLSSPNPAKPKHTKPVAGSLNKPVPFYTAITSSLPKKGKTVSAESLGQSPAIVDFFSAYYGVRYPFNTMGGVVTLQSFGLNLETQSKPTYAIQEIDRTSGPWIDVVAHELAHSFFGNSVTPARWQDVWLSESMAVHAAWNWSSTGTFFPVSLPDRLHDVYANAEYPISWRVAPADPKRAKDLFDGDGIYRRGPATIEAIREILGDDAVFKSMMRAWLTEHAYDSATTEDFIALVKRTDPARADRWKEFFRQWLYTSYPTPAAGPGQPQVAKPPMNVENFNTYMLPAG